MIRPRSLVWALVVMLGCGAGRPAFAASCSVSASGVNFGSYDPIGPADTRGTGTVRLSCDEAVNATVALSGGGSSSLDRAMRNGSSQLTYALYADSQRSSIWGDGTAGSQTVSFDGTVVDRSVYGTIPARQRVTAGSYSDTLTLTVSY